MLRGYVQSYCSPWGSSSLPALYMSWAKVALGQICLEYFSFSCQLSSFHQLFFSFTLSSGHEKFTPQISHFQKHVVLPHLQDEVKRFRKLFNCTNMVTVTTFHERLAIFSISQTFETAVAFPIIGISFV